MKKYLILTMALCSCSMPQKKVTELQPPTILTKPVNYPGSGSQIATNAKYETRVHGRIPVGDDMQLEAGTAHIRTGVSEFKQAPAVPGFYVHTPDPVEDERKLETLQNTANQQERLLKDALTAITEQNETLKASNQNLENKLAEADTKLSQIDEMRQEIAALKSQEEDRKKAELARLEAQKAEEKKSLWSKLLGK